MTIEESFRDLKSGALGAGLEHSLTHKRERLSNLLVLFALVQFAAWLIGWCEEHYGRGDRLEPRRKLRRRRYLTIRQGMEVFIRHVWWPPKEQQSIFQRRIANGSLIGLLNGSPI
ncbi:hypothetical protein [Burkholderia cepacia]|uniref:hypothetical protein n=1 Tax=Burkholderia cepacia TaxID=292 RepID=UPI003EDEAF05